MPAKLNRTEAYVVLNLLPQVGPRRLGRLLEVFGAPEEALAASLGDLSQVPSIGREIAARIRNWEQFTDLEKELHAARELGVEIVTRDDPFYPPLLREIYDPPILLYTLGRLSERERHCVGIVGSRQISAYGQECSRRFSYSLAKSGLTIVSGLALGIDTEAHKAALAAGGRTIAVIGSGVGHIYPAENKELARRIADGNGAVVSEFPLWQRPDKTTFPLRNRVISGMSEGLLVVEAGQRSGALITASQAVEQNRAVFAIPGPVDAATSVGCNRLIQEGARLAIEPADILSDLANLLDTNGRPQATLRKVPGYRVSPHRSTPRSDSPAPSPAEPLSATRPALDEWFEPAELDLRPAPPPPTSAATPLTSSAVPDSKPRRKTIAKPGNEPISVRPMPELEPREVTLLALLGTEPVSADLLIEQSGLSSGQLAAALMSLEMKHLARQLPGRMFARR